MGAGRGGARPEARAAAHVSAWGRRGRGGTGTGTGDRETGTREQRDRDTEQRHRHRGQRDRDTGTSAPGTKRPGQRHRHRRHRDRHRGQRDRDSGTSTGDRETGTPNSGTGNRATGNRETGTPNSGTSTGDRGTGSGTLTPARETGTAIPAAASGHRYRDRNGDGDTGTVIPAVDQGQEQRHRHRSSGAGTGTPAPPQLQRGGADNLGWVTLQELKAGRGSPGGATPAMEPPARACSCGSPASDSEVEAGSSLRSPPKPERSRKRPAGLDRAAPESPPSPRGGKRPRKGEGGDVPPSDGDRLFAQKCQELRGFIRPLAELLEGLRRGRYDRGLSSFQQSVAMDRLQRIIGVLQKPEMGARYLRTLLQVEAMLRLWFPHVAPKPVLDPVPPAAPQRRRPPAGPPGAPRCRRLPGDLPGDLPTLASPAGTLQQHGSPPCQAGIPESPPAPDV